MFRQTLGVLDRALQAIKDALSVNNGDVDVPNGTLSEQGVRVARQPGSSIDPGLGFGTWVTPNADRPTLVEINTYAQTDGTNQADTKINVDESGGTTADYTRDGARADYRAGSDVLNTDTTTVIIPAGGSYRIDNNRDPKETNSIVGVREFTL